MLGHLSGRKTMRLANGLDEALFAPLSLPIHGFGNAISIGDQQASCVKNLTSLMMRDLFEITTTVPPPVSFFMGTRFNSI